MRLFVGLPLDESLKDRLGSLQHRYLSIPGIRVEPSAKLHLTLLYIGEVNDEAPYIDALKTIKLPNFAVKVDRVGMFKNTQTVYYAGVADNEALASLAKAVSAAVRRVNPELKYRFVPHVTLARGKRQVPFTFDGPPVDSVLDKFILYESKEGQYIPKAEFPLI
ncbi:MAG: RNA 2',3'-cyclic phosphodiesterase [Bacilli bacterium]|jgi:2'-5' RNA ligase